MVYDDDSDDFEIFDVLEKCDVVVVICGLVQGLCYGNFYWNMQCVLDECEIDWLLFLQDDIQIVCDFDVNMMVNI